MSTKTYKKLDEISHLLERPDTYVGSSTNVLVDRWVYDQVSEKMIYKKNVKFNEALLKIINEGIDNCIDNSFINDNPTTTIKVEIDEEFIVIKNNGASIPVTQKDFGTGKSQYIPEVIFGEMRSGSNFNESRNSIGMNGLGIKACNILSSEFQVCCNDGTNKFSQVWTSNMRNKGTPKVTAVKNAPSFSTVIRFKPDLTFFNKRLGDFKISSLKDFEDIIYTRLLTVSVSHPNPIKIYFGSKQIKCKGLKAYMKLFTDERTFYDVVPGSEFEYGITLSSSGSFEHQSFVNCQQTTSDKSTHTRFVTNKVVSAISSHLKKKGMAVKLSSSQISNYLFVFVNARIKNPSFTSQTKIELSTPVNFSLEINKIIGLVKKSGLLNRLEDQLSTKALTSAQKALNSSSKSSTLSIPKLDDAHNAGTSKSVQATLFLVEGDSAKTMVTTGQSVIGRKNYGAFPLKGKLLNCIGASPKKLSENKEICNIMKIVGLNFSKKYETEQEFKSLRYGQVCVLTDADVDGIHILGLIVTFVNTFWPALVKRKNFLTRFITPLLKVKTGSSVKMFFTTEQYENWRKSNSKVRHTTQHLKGLGTSLRTDTLKYFQDMHENHLKSFTCDDDTKELIKRVFDPKESNWRKDWLMKKADTQRLDYKSSSMNLSTFMRTEMYEYSSYNIKRAIPSAVDGLKVSQRKIIFHCLDRFKNKKTQPFKVAQLASTTAAATNYAHGENSLQQAIINLGQNFSGSNNMALLTADGAFGSRMCNGNDAASPRYIFTRITDECRKLFDILDDQVLNYIVEENTSVEPSFYVPSLPLVLLNGSCGIATGFRNVIPSFNSNDIIYNIKARLNNFDTRDMLPFYAGTYKTNHLTTFEDGSYIFRGRITFKSDQEAVIDEIPIGISIEDYKDRILQSLIDKGLLKKIIVDHISENEPRFIIHGNGSKSLHEIDFKLNNIMTTKCMNLLDIDGVVKNFQSPISILDYWLDIRKDYLQKNKQVMLKNMQHQIDTLTNKANFIKAIVDNRIVVKGKTKAQLTLEMTQLNLVDHDHLLTIPLMSLTKERILALNKEIHDLNLKKNALGTTSVNKLLLKAIENEEHSHKRVLENSCDTFQSKIMKL